MLEHCLDAEEQILRERQYRAYITDCLMTLCNNVAHGLGGSAINARWMDSFKEPDPRTPEQIAHDVVENAGLTPKGGE